MLQKYLIYISTYLYGINNNYKVRKSKSKIIIKYL